MAHCLLQIQVNDLQAVVLKLVPITVSSSSLGSSKTSLELYLVLNICSKHAFAERWIIVGNVVSFMISHQDQETVIQ